MNKSKNKNQKSKRPKIKPEYLRLDEKTNAIDYLEKAYEYVKQTEKNTMSWKWAIIALHNALYGFAICACAGTSPELVAPSIKKGKNKGNRELISLNKALAYCQDPAIMERFDFSKTLQLTQRQKSSIDLLKNTFRNNFEHFSPKGWSIELHGIAHILIDIFDIIRFLAIDTGNIRLTPTQERKIKSLIFQSKQTLKKSKLYKETEKLETNQA